MKKAAKATYGRKGDKIVQMNYDAIDAGAKQVVEVEVPESWKSCEDEGLFSPEVKDGKEDVVDFVKNIQAKVNAQEGNSLPVSAFNDYVDGSTPVSYTHLVERNSEYALGIVFSVIDRRIRSGRPLIITTNLPLKEIKSETMLDKRRIYDRILEMCTPMYVGGTSKREAIASMKMEKAKTLLNTKNDRVYCG